MGKRWLIVAIVLLYVAAVYGGASLKGEYSHVSQYISELNATGSAWGWQIGYLGLLPLGLLALITFPVIAPSTRLSGASQIGYWMLIAEPIAYAGSTFAPCDPGCPSTGSLSQNIHNVLGGVTLLITTIGLALLFFNDMVGVKKRVGWLLLAGMYISLYALALIPDFAPWRGLLQRLAEGILYGCLCLVGWRLLAAEEDSSAEE